MSRKFPDYLLPCEYVAEQIVSHSMEGTEKLFDEKSESQKSSRLHCLQVLKAEPYLELSSGQSAHCYQLFVEKDPNIEIPTVQVT